MKVFLATNMFGVISYVLARDMKAKILIYSMVPKKLYAPKLLKAGAKGFVSKKAQNSELIKAVTVILNDREYWSEPFTASSTGAEMENQFYPFSVLSAKELDILNYIIPDKCWCKNYFIFVAPDTHSF